MLRICVIYTSSIPNTDAPIVINFIIIMHTALILGIKGVKL